MQTTHIAQDKAGGGLMAAKLEPLIDKNGKRSDQGIFKRGSRYVIVWKHRGRQHRESFPTLKLAREAKGQRQGGDKQAASRVGFKDFFSQWIESLCRAHRTGVFSGTTRPEYRRPIEAHALPRWGTWKLADVEPTDVRDLFGAMRTAGESTSAIKKTPAALSAMFSTAVEDKLLRFNPVSG
jgi:hypothetical protein